MKTRTIYRDDNKIVKAVWYAGKFLYTRTYFLNNEQVCEKEITVWNDGTVTVNGEVHVINELD